MSDHVPSEAVSFTQHHARHGNCELKCPVPVLFYVCPLREKKNTPPSPNDKVVTDPTAILLCTPSPTLARRLHFGLNPSAAPRSAKVPRKCRLSFPPGVCGVCCCEGSQLEAKPCCKHRVSKYELRSCQPCSSQVAKQQFICNSCETGYSDIHILLIKQTSERKGISSIKYGNSYVGNRSGR